MGARYSDLRVLSAAELSITQARTSL